MLKKTLMMLVLGSFSFSTLVATADDVSYEQTVAELKAALKEEPPAKVREPLDVPMEAGVAVAASFVTLGQNGSAPGDAILKGFDLHFGVEPFHPKWIIEGAFRSFGSERSSPNYAVSLTEFDLKIAHRHEFDRNMYLRTGAGVSARYLRTSDSRNGQSIDGVQQTPALILLAGVDKRVSNRFSFGPDLSYRIPMVRDTGERPSVDGSLRLNMRF